LMLELFLHLLTLIKEADNHVTHIMFLKATKLNHPMYNLELLYLYSNHFLYNKAHKQLLII